ncbi:MAG: hypothetical protein C5B53_06410 [Candidatus Melainabacteria bacterium]|nr:MAG: hypothetical protein C5B53_06410 [Candidatus Melainabacteria bacterium]
MKLSICRRFSSQSVALILVLLLPAYCGELLSGSTPLKAYFLPVAFLCHTALYGCGTLLIRELSVRWGLRWSQIFLAIAYGVVEEGLCCKSFFDPNWKDLRGLNNYASLFGVQWAWTLLLITVHMTLSTLIPIRIVDMLFPSLADRPLVGRRGMILAGLAFSAVVICGFIGFPFRLSLAKTVASLAVVAALAWLAYTFRKSENPVASLNKSKILKIPPILAVSALVLTTVTTFTPYLLSSFRFVPPAATVTAQVLILLMVAIFSLATICQNQIDFKRDSQFILGCLSYWIITSFLQGNWMCIVGAVTIVLCVLWFIFSMRANKAKELANSLVT